MEHKPWPIILLAFCHILEPVAKLLFYSWYWHIPFYQFFLLLSWKTPFVGFMFFFAFPVAGLAILAVRAWSLPVFLLIEGLTVYGHIHYYSVNPAMFPGYLLESLMAFNIIVVSYFLIPSVWHFYFTPNLRWWESKPRYSIKAGAVSSQQGKQSSGHVQNVSLGGALWTSKVACATDAPIYVRFKTKDFIFSATAKVIYSRQENGVFKSGIQFNLRSRAKAKVLYRWLKELEKQGVDRYPPRRQLWKSFRQWVITLATTGEGAIPRAKKTHKPSTEKKAA